MTQTHTSPTTSGDALGPLVVSERNPRYFTVSGDPSGRAVYLAGSHIWHNLQDGIGPGRSCSDDPERMDFGEYLDFLTERGHHFAPGGGDTLWAWRTFLRGHHPILMDFGIIGGVNPPDPAAGGPLAFEAFEPARFAMGDTIRYARRMRLIEMEPAGNLCSTGYALANLGVEYLALQSAPGEAITMTLDPGTYSVEWFGVDDRETVRGADVTVREAGPVSLEPPLDGPGVVYLTTT